MITRFCSPRADYLKFGLFENLCGLVLKVPKSKKVNFCGKIIINFPVMRYLKYFLILLHTN